ncbi:Uncharacterised protein [Raoultella planticola]|uniref:Uncharacterized protein n=1 Tax=Raoultella planticola TaxID=575 RepID=A0A485D2D9_RAOPL|nr:Uncharacterised protein [Raoultella planticola]
MEQYRLTMRGISKTYGNAAALQDVDFSVQTWRGSCPDW